MIDKEGYTQREWDRVVGYGKVPKKSQKTDGTRRITLIEHFHSWR